MSVDVFASTEELVAIEKACIAKFKAKAEFLRAASPSMTRQTAFAKACEALPRAANNYQLARHLLAARGIAAQPLGI
jgi:hypothetical protein